MPFDVAGTAEAAETIAFDLINRGVRPLGEREQEQIRRVAAAAARVLGCVNAFQAQRLGDGELATLARLDWRARQMMPLIEHITGADLSGSTFGSILTISNALFANWLAWVEPQGRA